MEQRATINRMGRLNVRRLPADWGQEEEALLTALDDATATPVDITYRLAAEWCDGIADVLDDLEEAAARRPDVVVELCEHLLVRLDAAMASVDDSDGGIVELRNWTLELHQRLAGQDADARLAALGDLEILR
jgi:hypothetical protein